MANKKSSKKSLIERLIKKYGARYSEILGIKLNNDEKEIFKWWLAAGFLGARISENIALRTYREFEKADLLNINEISKASRGRIIRVLGKGGYARYDGLTTTRLKRMCKKLKQEYKGKITYVHREAKDADDLEKRLQEFWRVGPVTVNIFLRELRQVWKKADPLPSQFVKYGARSFKIDLNKFNKKTKKFIKLECALLRAGRALYRKHKTKEEILKSLE